MGKIQRTADYYQLMIDKFAKTSLSPNQLRVYKEIKELVLSCSSLDEIQQKMKSSGYYESPGQALYMDKMMALKKAATINNFTELATIYQDRYDEVKADYNKMYEIGYNGKVLAFFTKQSTILSAFYEIYSNYLSHKSANVYDLLYKSSLDSIRDNYNKLKSLGTDFRAVSQDKYFREHIILSDADFMIFVSEVEFLISKFEAEQSEIQRLTEITEKAWFVLKDKKSDIQEIARKENAKTKRSVFMAIPPADISGKYVFVSNEQEDF